MADSPTVFVSYAHDFGHHKAQVLRLCLLRQHDADLDGYVDERRLDWYSRMIQRISESDYVLVIESPCYRAVGDGNGPADRIRGRPVGFKPGHRWRPGDSGQRPRSGFVLVDQPVEHPMAADQSVK